MAKLIIAVIIVIAITKFIIAIAFKHLLVDQ